MADKVKWLRVTRQYKCPICLHVDWCCYSPELKLILCMRVESPAPSKGEAGGWLHPLDGERIKTLTAKTKPERKIVINAAAMFKYWQDRTTMEQVNELAAKLGVQAFALHSIGVAWASEHQAWVFPMKNSQGNILGLRLRNDHADKWSVKGSYAALFVSDEEPRDICYICEGPTDTAAALSIGLYAIGRPSCLGQEDMVNEALNRLKIKRVIIIGDGDGPGERGALKLQDSLKLPSLIWFPPAKDLREFVRAGGTAQMAMNLCRDLVWRMA